MGGAVCLAAATSICADALVTYAAPLKSRSIRGVGDGNGENAAPDSSGTRSIFPNTSRVSETF